MKVQVELDKWDERRSNLHPAHLDDDSQITIGLQTTRNNKIVLDRSISLGEYCFRVFVEEYRGETFFVRAAMGIRRKGRRASRTNPGLRERPLKPTIYPTGDAYWTLDRTGVFAGFPEAWDDFWANNFIKETLDGLRSPEIPKHFELHGDNPDEMYYEE